MKKLRGPTLSIRAKGPLAIFTRPELKTERVSYEVPTPSAIRGIFEAICWKPAIQWHVERIYVFNEIAFTAIKRNEVTSKSSTPTRSMVSMGIRNFSYNIDVESVRAQRNTVALKDVDYQFEAFFTMTDKAGSEDNIYKFIDIFSRRVEKGQHFHQPYFGCRECIAEISPGLEHPQEKTIAESKELGIMLWDIAFQAKETGKNLPLFFHAVMNNGIVDIPASPIGYEEVRYDLASAP
jgi:CRISPR-associated protein Cas5d